ncbi:hypothetical protein [Cryobacterium sp. Y50]|uniref:hypothetical protein n=1 Tax=Cryobacterium sp. Y50 TaxID=2048286 RepID=UPI001304BE4E|nr:hypothetical protein [Cryobacterium sp. Y50]
MREGTKQRTALRILIVGVIILILAAVLVTTSGVLATWLDPERETSTHLTQ